MTPDNKVPPESPKRNLSSWVYMLLLLICASYLFYQYNSSATSSQSNWSEVKSEMLIEGQVEKLVVVNNEKVEVYIKDEYLNQGIHENIPSTRQGPHYTFKIGSVESFEKKLYDVEKEYELNPMPVLDYKKEINWIGNILAWTLPLLFIIAIWSYALRRSSLGGLGTRGTFDFGKSKAKLFDEGLEQKISFKDVAGLESAKVEIMEIVDFLKTPDAYTRLGAKIPKGVMLVGPPGTGKTLLAKAVAGESKVPFFFISGSAFVEMFVGVGASRVRDLFRQAKEKAPSIIFIDEIDAVGRSRGKAFSLQSNDERENTLNQLLAEMDGFDANIGVIVLAATNRPEILDKALLRPGRFDRHIYLELPSLSEREEIFKVHIRRIKLADDVDISQIAGQTPGFSGADIANICNEAALIAARKKKDAVYKEDFSQALDRIIGGLERKGKILSTSEKRIIAFHEAGHATASWFLEHADTLLKVSIVPRGKSLGAAWYLPEESHLMTKSQFLDRICTALGGRAAEELTFDEVSSGALDDLEKVTKLAYAMVAYYGLNEELGNTSFYDSTGSYSESIHKPYGEETANLIDEQVRILVESAYVRTKSILKEHQEQLHQLADLLIKNEIAEKTDLEKIFGVKTSPRLAEKTI